MEANSVCRCCLAEGFNKDLHCTYFSFDKKEIYSDMLKDCFNIVLTPSQKSNSICDACISSLRQSVQFRDQIIKAEKQFLCLIQETNDNEEKPLEVKLEPKMDSGDESDDYFLADAVRLAEQNIKEEEVEPKKKAQKATKKKTAEKKKKKEWKKDQIKSLVTRLKTSMNSLPDIKIKKSSQKTRTITILPSKEIIPVTRGKEKESKIKVMFTTRTARDKEKHRDNLQTLLKYSNMTPFKNKSLLGFICGYCDSTFPDPADLRRHTEVEHKKERLNFKSNFNHTEYSVKVDTTDLTCTLCDEKLDNINGLKDHLVKVHNKIIYTDIKDHIVQYRLTKGDVYDCAMCSATYETFKMLKQHMNVHYCNYSCPKCDTSFATKRSLSAHISTHQEGSFKCNQCEKVFPSLTKKRYHEKTKHLGTRNISNCPYCNEPFRSYYQRNQHLIKVHNNEAQYKCNVCQKSYILKSLLMYHIKKSHLMERNCQCTECGYRFFSKKALKAHMVKHTGERNFVCEVCHKSYARKYTLREHMRIHNNDRRFKCDICAMSFVQKCSLKSHLLSNHGISMAASEIKSLGEITNNCSAGFA